MGQISGPGFTQRSHDIASSHLNQVPYKSNSYGSTMHFSRNSSKHYNLPQALAEPSNTIQASAELSSETGPSSVLPKTHQVLKTSTRHTSAFLTDYSQDTIDNQRDIIASIWPSTTLQARLIIPSW